VIREIDRPSSGIRSIPDELPEGMGTGFLRGAAFAAALSVLIWSCIIWGITKLV
jgi:hypothetical protein